MHVDTIFWLPYFFDGTHACLVVLLLFTVFWKISYFVLIKRSSSVHYLDLLVLRMPMPGRLMPCRLCMWGFAQGQVPMTQQVSSASHLHKKQQSRCNKTGPLCPPASPCAFLHKEDLKQHSRGIDAFLGKPILTLFLRILEWEFCGGLFL
jgi:hypothetical protein